jgi:dehydrogenase/reductase SDR family member 12
MNKLIEKIKWKYNLSKNLDPSFIFKTGKKDLPDALNGFVFVITSAGFGLGMTVSRNLKDKGARVYRLMHEFCDMSDAKQIKAFCDEIKSKETKVDGIINLANCMNPNYETNELGIEKTFATNVVGPYLLFKNLYQLMENSRSPRVLVTLNPFFLNEKLEPNDINFSSIKYGAWKAFIQCERRRVELWKNLAKEYPNVRFNTVNPGFVHTSDLEKKLPAFCKKYDSNLRWSMYGDYLVEWCAISEKINSIPSGALISDKKPVKEYIFEYNKTSQVEHQQFIANFKLLVERINN